MSESGKWRKIIRKQSHNYDTGRRFFNKNRRTMAEIRLEEEARLRAERVYAGDKNANNVNSCRVCGNATETLFCFNPQCIAMQNFVNCEHPQELPFWVKGRSEMWLVKADNLLPMCRLPKEAAWALAQERVGQRQKVEL